MKTFTQFITENTSEWTFHKHEGYGYNRKPSHFTNAEGHILHIRPSTDYKVKNHLRDPSKTKYRYTVTHKIPNPNPDAFSPVTHHISFDKAVTGESNRHGEKMDKLHASLKKHMKTHYGIDLKPHHIDEYTHGWYEKE